MTVWSRREDVKIALQEARRALKAARQLHGKESDAAKRALKKCNDLQYLLDSWDSRN